MASSNSSGQSQEPEIQPVSAGTADAVPPGMRPLDELKALAGRVAAEHASSARACDARWQDELDQRRRELAQAQAALLRTHG